MNQVFMPDPDRIKHEVPDGDARRSHPLFESLYNQSEAAVQDVMRLRKRRIVVKMPDHDQLFRLQTPTVPKPLVGWDEIARIKNYLSQQSGRPIHELEQAVLKRREGINQPLKNPAADKKPYDFWKTDANTEGEIAAT